MTRTNRLFELMQLLRSKRHPTAASVLADELGISQRTLYRDIDTLRSQGADIQGEAGVGFILKDNFTLPPLMFSADEIEALVLGARWVKAYGDEALMSSAKQALSKIRAVSSQAIQHEIDTHTLFVPPASLTENPTTIERTLPFAAEIRVAIRQQRKMQIRYEDANGDLSDRDICPFALAFWGPHQVVAAWCELREDYRHFRVDRIVEIIPIDETYTPNKQTHLQQWRQTQCIGDDFDEL